MTPEQRLKCMSHNRAKNTGPELLLRRAIWRLGFRYRVNDKHLPGSPDIVLPKYHTVIFVHGCFWHGHKDCKNATTPKTNTEFWKAKITRNQERDQEVWRKLEAKGWYVLIVWECELKKDRFESTLKEVIDSIRKNGDTYNDLQASRKRARLQYQEEQRQRKERESSLKAEIKSRK